MREERLDAALVLQGALKDTLTMPLGDFRLLFDAMHRRTASLFVGRVEIDVPNADTEVIPFAARMDDLEGQIFSFDAAAQQDGRVQVSLTNDIESPVAIQTLDATITRDGQPRARIDRGQHDTARATAARPNDSAQSDTRNGGAVDSHHQTSPSI